MDNDDPSARPRKHRFIPRAQPRKKREPSAPAPDVGDGDDDGQETHRDQTPLSRSNNYESTDYPITLPLRQPNSGDPKILDENEFGEDAEKEYDESTINPASELGLLVEEKKAKLLFFQLPSILPLTSKPSATVMGKEKVGGSTSLESTGAPNKVCSLEELPGACTGKMLVYKSGAVKLRLGDTLYDVAPGSDIESAQDVVVANTAEKKCIVLGELRRRAVVTPDVDSLLNVINKD